MKILRVLYLYLRLLSILIYSLQILTLPLSLNVVNKVCTNTKKELGGSYYVQIPTVMK